MPRKAPDKAISALLSALLLTWAVLPPGMQHVHENGADPEHRHGGGCSNQQADVDRHGHSHGDAHHHASDDDWQVTAAPVVHVHQQVLWFEFATPSSSTPGDRESRADSTEVFLVRAIDETTSRSHVGPSIDRVMLAMLYAGWASGVDQTLDYAPVSRADSSTAIPLCDAARLERTGVLLA